MIRNYVFRSRRVSFENKAAVVVFSRDTCYLYHNRDFHSSSTLLKKPNIQSMKFFAATLPGIEDLAVHELQSLGINKINVPKSQKHIGGVEFQVSSLEEIMKCHLYLGTVSNLLLRTTNEAFHVTHMNDLVKIVANMKIWKEYFRQKKGKVDLDLVPVFDIRVTSSKSRLYHTKGIAERVERGIIKAVGGNYDDYIEKVKKYEKTKETDQSKLRIVVRIIRDMAQISIDTSTTPLHKRGYRLETGKAPLREDLAWSFLYAQDFQRNRQEIPYDALIDPTCGSGTILIEGAALAHGLPPNRLKRPPFKHSQLYNGRLWKKLIKSSRQGKNKTQRDTKFVIIGSDRDAGAIKIANANAKRAGVSEFIEFIHTSISGNPAFEKESMFDIQRPLLVSNPPYGRRVSRTSKPGREGISPLLPLYQTLGMCWKQLTPQASFGIIAHDVNLARKTGVINLSPIFTSQHGGLSVTALSTKRKRT